MDFADALPLDDALRTEGQADFGAAFTQKSFQEIFEALKPVFEEYAGRLAIQVDKPGEYYLETKTAMRKGQHFQFGGVRIGKAYVSFHLMPIYMNPKLQAAISPNTA